MTPEERMREAMSVRDLAAKWRESAGYHRDQAMRALAENRIAARVAHFECQELLHLCATDLEAALAAERPGGWVRIEDAIAAVDAEGELSGPMPDALRKRALKDPEEFARATVRLTKRGIRNRIMTHARLIDPPPEVPHG